MMTSLSGTVSRMLREVMFASGVWYCVLLCVSQAVGALDISLAVMVGHFRARKKSILTTQTFLDVFGPSAGATRLLTWLKSPRISAAGPRIRGGRRYKVLGSDSDLWQHSTLIPCTHECYDSVLHTRPTRAHRSIFAATALLATATPPRLRH